MLFKNILLLAASAAALQIPAHGLDDETHHVGRSDGTTGTVTFSRKLTADDKAKAVEKVAQFEKKFNSLTQANLKQLQEHRVKLDAHSAKLRQDAARLREEAAKAESSSKSAQAAAAAPTTLQVVTKTSAAVDTTTDTAVATKADAAVVIVKPTLTVKPATSSKI